MTQEVIKSEGKYDLLSMTLSVGNKALDISGYVVKCDIYESILSPSIVAEVIVSDSTGLFSASILTEQELCVSWTTHEDAPPKHYRLNVVEVNPVLKQPNDRGVSFTLTCMNEEVLRSANIVDLPLVRQQIEADKTVRTLLEKAVETEKDLFIEKTKGLHTFAFSNITPFEAIDKVRMSAVSTEHPASAYVFYENQAGFHFKTLEGIVKEAKENIGDKYFMHSNLAGLDPEGSRWRNIIAWKLIQNGNQNIANQIGGYNNSSRRLNLIEGNLDSYEKQANEVDFVSLNEGSVISGAENVEMKSKQQGSRTFSIYNSDQESNQVGEKQNFLPYYLSHFLSVVAHMTIYGDSTITVGDVITARIPSLTSLTDESYTEDDPILTGNYLVCKVRHVLTFGDDPNYFQGLEVVKDGVAGDQPKTRLS